MQACELIMRWLHISAEEPTRQTTIRGAEIRYAAKRTTFSSGRLRAANGAHKNPLRPLLTLPPESQMGASTNLLPTTPLGESPGSRRMVWVHQTSHTTTF